MMSIPLAAWRLLLLVAWTALVLPAYWPLSWSGARVAVPLVRFYWRVACRLIGVEVEMRGAAPVAGRALFVGNHASYLDIPVLGSVLPGFFVAKREVAGWPGIGPLARIARTVFVERRANRSAEQRDELQRRLDAGDSLILFPEGTSSDGNRVLPFKSALFSVAERDGGTLPVQPFSVAYTRLDGMPLGRVMRPFYAWYGDMVLAPHIWTVLGLGRVRVEVELYPPMTVREAGSRKLLAFRAHALVAEGVARALAGRPAAAADSPLPASSDPLPAGGSPSVDLTPG